MEVRVENSKIQQVPCCKCIGVVVDEDLKRTKYIELVCNKLVNFIGIVYKLRSKLPAWCLRSIYYSYVHPHLLYGVEVYDNTHSTYLDEIIKLNNESLRILQNQDTACSNYDLYLILCQSISCMCFSYFVLFINLFIISVNCLSLSSRILCLMALYTTNAPGPVISST
jgi:hypothetical protein